MNGSKINHIGVKPLNAEQTADLLVTAIEFERMKNQVADLTAQLSEKEKLIKEYHKHAVNLLNEWESWLELGVEYSDASKEEYLAAAEFMKKQGRSGYDAIEEVTRSLND